MPAVLLQWKIWPQKCEIAHEKVKWIQYLRPNKTWESSCLGEGFCAQSWDRSLPYSLWTSRVWVMITKRSLTLQHWNASSWTARTTVRALENSDAVLFGYKSWLLLSHIFRTSSPLESKLEPILADLFLWSVSGQFHYNQQKPPAYIHCRWLAVLSGHQEHWPSCRGTPCCHSQLHTASVLNSRSVRTGIQHKAYLSVDFSPTQYLLGISFVAIALLKQPKIIKTLNPRWKLMSKDRSLTFRLWLFLCKISSCIATYSDSKGSVRMETHIMNVM